VLVLFRLVNNDNNNNKQVRHKVATPEACCLAFILLVKLKYFNLKSSTLAAIFKGYKMSFGRHIYVGLRDRVLDGVNLGATWRI